MKRWIAAWDPTVLILSGWITLCGLFFVFDAGFARSIRDGFGPVPREFIMQLAFTVLALGAGMWGSRCHTVNLVRGAGALWAISLVLLVAVMFPVIGLELNGAHRWIKIGPVTIQPAEFAKLTTILYIAAVLSTRKDWPKKLPRIDGVAKWMDVVGSAKVKRMLPAVWVALGIGLIVIEPDLGTGAVVAAVAWAMCAIGGVSRSSMVLGTLVAAGLVLLSIKIEPYRMERITNHAQRWDEHHADNVGYQTIQAELGAASGGWVGVGAGAGRVKQMIPAPTTDFIPATIAEEFGFLGWLVVTGSLAALTFRLFQLVGKAPTKFGQLVVAGVACWIGVQSVVNLMMANGFLPAIGIPLPLVSSGGSSLIALWLALGISQAVLAPVVVGQKQEAHEANRNGRRHRRTRLSRA